MVTYVGGLPEWWGIRLRIEQPSSQTESSRQKRPLRKRPSSGRLSVTTNSKGQLLFCLRRVVEQRKHEPQSIQQQGGTLLLCRAARES